MGMIATLAGARVTSARVTLPAWGAWYADASVDGARTLSGAVELKIADLTLRGAVLSGGPEKQNGRSHYRLVGGAGGWGRTIRAKSYANDAGVKVATVLADAASEVGETLSISSDARTGPAFVRPEGPASRVLEQLAPGAWYIDEAGTTRLGRRPAKALAGSVPRVSPVDKALGTVTLAPDAIAALVPGVQVDGLEAVDVLHEVTPDGIRTTLWGANASATSRRLSAWRLLFDQLDPLRRFRGVSEYRVVTQSGKRLNVQPVRVSAGMPDLQRVVARPGIPGAEADVALGSRVLVGFVDSDPGRPYVAAYEDAEGEGWAPDRLRLDAPEIILGGASGTKEIARSPAVVSYSNAVKAAIQAAATTATDAGSAPVTHAGLGTILGAIVTALTTANTALSANCPSAKAKA